MYIRVKTFPGFKNEKIETLAPDRLKVYLRERAENNAANRRLIVIVAEHLSIPQTALRIVSGHKHQNKILEVNKNLSE